VIAYAAIDASASAITVVISAIPIELRRAAVKNPVLNAVV